MLLRIIGRPVLAVEQGIGDARVRLIHAHHDAARGKRLRPGLVAALFAGDIAGGRGGELLDLDVLALQHLDQFDYAIGFSGVGWQ